MGQNRKPFVEMQPAPRPSIPVASETLRNGDSAPAACPPRGGEEKISVFWRVFGGTLLSIAALIVMTVYQQLSSNITDLRNAVVHVSETSADMVKKDDLNNRTTSIWNTLKEVTTQLPAMKTHDDILDSQFKTAEQERKELVNKLQALNERLVKLEALQAAAAARPAPAVKALAAPPGWPKQKGEAPDTVWRDTAIPPVDTIPRPGQRDEAPDASPGIRPSVPGTHRGGH